METLLVAKRDLIIAGGTKRLPLARSTPERDNLGVFRDRHVDYAKFSPTRGLQRTVSSKHRTVLFVVVTLRYDTDEESATIGQIDHRSEIHLLAGPAKIRQMWR